MRSVLTVTTPPASLGLTTLTRVKSELAITDSAQDTLLTARIAEASAAIDSYLGRDLAHATLTETFRLNCDENPENLPLARFPVVAVTAVTEDGITVPPAQYELDAAPGHLYRLDTQGSRSQWRSSIGVTVAYSAGYLLPNDAGRTLPGDLEQAVVKLVCGMHLAAGRDPAIKAEEVPGVQRIDYWVGAIGGSGGLPPDVTALLDPYRNVTL